MKISTARIGILFFISPIVGLLDMIGWLRSGERKVVYFYALLLGLFAFLTAPANDLYRHHDLYADCQDVKLLLINIVHQGDFLVQTIYHLFGSIGIKFDYCRLLFHTISCLIYCKLFVYSTRFSGAIYGKFICFVLFLGLFDFLGVRAPLATAFLLMGYYELFLRHRWAKSMLWFIFASITHFFCFPLSIIFIISYILPNIKVNNLILFIACVVCITFGLFIVGKFAGYFYEEKSSYIDGMWGMQATPSLAGRIYIMLTRLPAIPLLLFFLKTGRGSYHNRNLIIVLLLLTLSCYNLLTICSRVYPCLFAVLFFYYLRYSHNKYLVLQVLIVFALAMNFMSKIYTNRDFFTMGNNSYICLFEPLPLLLENEFSTEWINDHIRLDGEFKNSTH